MHHLFSRSFPISIRPAASPCSDDRPRRLARRVLSIAVLAAFVTALALLPECHAQAPVQGGASGGAATTKAEDKTLTTKDGIAVRITYFPSSLGTQAPCVIMLPGKKGNRRIWNTTLAEPLQQAGYAVVTVDLRGHGETALVPGVNAGNAGVKKAETATPKPRDYQAMIVGDLEAVKKFLFDEHQAGHLNMNKTAIIGADFSAVVAMVYAEADWAKTPYDDAPTPATRTPRGQDIRALVLLSPDGTVSGLNASNAANALRTLRIPVMIGIGKGDNQDRGAAKKLFEQLTIDKRDDVYKEEYDGKYRGTDLIGKKLKVESNILVFLDKHLKKLPGEWQDRRSRLER